MNQAKRCHSRSTCIRFCRRGTSSNKQWQLDVGRLLLVYSVSVPNVQMFDCSIMVWRELLLVLRFQVEGYWHQEIAGHDRHHEEGVILDTGPDHADASGGPRALLGGIDGRG